MKLSAALFALFAFPTFVTPISLIDKRELSNDMFDIVDAIGIYAEEYNIGHGYSKSAFTQNIVQALYKRNPHFNYIICHSDHDYNFGNSWGVDVYNVWVVYEKRATIFSNYPGYDVVIGKNGTFSNWGDGGYQNWAYIGNVIDTGYIPPDFEGYMVTFGPPA